jgi:hypothetical protein
MKKSKPDSETIGEWVYFRGENGDLYRSPLAAGENAKGAYVISAERAEFALRCARISAGLPEYGKSPPPPIRPRGK